MKKISRAKLKKQLEKECMVDIPGYEGIYKINKYGQIKSLDRYINHSYKNRKRVFIGDFISSSNNGKGYLQAHLYKDGNRKVFYIHRLVATLFVPNYDNKKSINHIDNNRSNNYYANLEWCTQKDNILHASNQNRMKCGDSHYRSKISDKQRNNIIYFYNNNKVSYKQLANIFDIKHFQAYRIINFDRKQYMGDTIEKHK